MDRKVFMAFLLSLAVVGLIVLALTVFRPFLMAFMWAGVLATVSYPAHHQLLHLLKGHKTITALVMTMLVLFLIIVPVLFVASLFYQQAADIVDVLQTGDVPTTVEEIERHAFVQKAAAWVKDLTGNQVDLSDEIQKAAKKIAPFVAQGAADVGAFLFGILANLFFTVLALFYFYRDGDKLMTVLRELAPLRDSDRDAIFGDIQAAINASVRGGLLTALSQGALGFIIFFILGVEEPVLWATVMTISSFVPLIGTALVWLPMAAWFALDGQLDKGLVLVGYGVLVIGMADNFLRPILVGRHMEANPLLLFFGVLGGIAAFGFVGLVLGPVVVAFLTVTTRLFRREFTSVEEAAAPAESG
jgi:predicted PurR-regulated permease PerM